MEKKIAAALEVIITIFLIVVVLYGFYVNYENHQINIMLKSIVERSDTYLEESESILEQQKEDLAKNKATRSALEERIAQIENMLGIKTN